MREAQASCLACRKCPGSVSSSYAPVSMLKLSGQFISADFLAAVMGCWAQTGPGNQAGFCSFLWLWVTALIVPATKLVSLALWEPFTLEVCSPGLPKVEENLEPAARS